MSHFSFTNRSEPLLNNNCSSITENNLSQQQQQQMNQILFHDVNNHHHHYHWYFVIEKKKIFLFLFQRRRQLPNDMLSHFRRDWFCIFPPLILSRLIWNFWILFVNYWFIWIAWACFMQTASWESEIMDFFLNDLTLSKKHKSTLSL